MWLVSETCGIHIEGDPKLRNDIVFCDLNTQRCFLDEDGGAPVADRARIRDNLRRLTDVALKTGIRILSTESVQVSGMCDESDQEQASSDGSHKTMKVHETRVVPSLTIGTDGHLPVDLEDALGAWQVVIQLEGLDPLVNPAVARLLDAVPAAHAVVYGIAGDQALLKLCKYLRESDRAVTVVLDALGGLKPGLNGQLVWRLGHLGVTARHTYEIVRSLQNGA
jgi:hypothetical protein